MESKAKGFAISLVAHAAVILALFLAHWVGGCRMRKEPLKLVEFTVAVDPSMTMEEPPAPPAPDVKPPPPPPARPDDIVRPTPKKPEPKKPEPKKPEPKKPEPKKPQPPKIEKGKRVNRPVESKVKPRTPQTLSDEEVAKLLNRGATIGETTSLPDNEVSRNASLLMNALYDAWTPPAAPGRPAEVTFAISPDGTLLSARISSSSGDAAFDASCLEAVRRVGRVRGLSAAFIRAYGSGCPFQFREKE